MSFFSRLAGNAAFNRIRGLSFKGAMASARSFAGAATDVGGLRQAGRLFMKGGGYYQQGRMGMARGYYGRAGRAAAGWFGGAGFTGARRGGIAAARIGGAAVGGMAAADFLNPWGLGWGD